MNQTPQSSVRRWLLAGAVAATTVLSASAASALTVVPVPQNPQDLTVPHAAFNGASTRFKAIVRDGSAPYSVSIDYTGDGVYDTTFNTSDAYELEATYTYPNVAVDTLHIASIRVVDNGGNTAFGSYPVYIRADCPTMANVNSATDDQLAHMRNRAIDEGMWYIHKNMAGRGGSNNQITGYIDQSSYDTSVSAAYIWGLTLNGHIAAYPPGTYAGAWSADQEFQNNQMWNNTPYAEDAIRIINYLMSGMAYQNNVPAYDEADDGNPTIAGTNDNRALYHQNYIYAMGHIVGGLIVATAPLGNTEVQIGTAAGQSWPYVGQQLVDWLVYAQADADGNNNNGLGGWYYNARSTIGSSSDMSTVQWALIGIESGYRAMADYGVYVNNLTRARIANQMRYGTDSNGGARYRNSRSSPAASSNWTDNAYGGLKITGGNLVGAGLLGWNDTTQFNCDGANGVNVNEQPYAPTTTLTRCQAHNLYLSSYNFLSNGFQYHFRNSNYNSASTNNANTNIHMYAIYSTQKGARSLVPELDAFGANDWFHQFSVALLRDQGSDGSWWGKGPYRYTSDYVGRQLGTAYGVLVLTQTLFNPKPEAVGNVAPASVVEGCSGGAAGQVTFSHAASFHPDPDANIVAFQWDFDSSDGLWWETGAAADFETADVNQAFTHTYNTRGSYTATLRVVDNTQPDPQTDLQIHTVTVQAVENLAPSANANGAYIINDGDDLTLAGTGSDANANCGDSISAAWDLDDDGQYDDAVGLTPTIGANSLSGLARSVALPISLRVTDSNGASTDSDTTLTIFNNRPVACFNINPNRGSCGQAIT
ncbi:MAG: PKD domain-containing protein, partial [Bradymonadia bacterium]